jgi:hypothetical protein
MNLQKSNAHSGTPLDQDKIVAPFIEATRRPIAMTRQADVSPTSGQMAAYPKRTSTPILRIGSRLSQGSSSPSSKPSESADPSAEAQKATPPSATRAAQFPPIWCKRREFQSGAAREIAALATEPRWLKIERKVDWAKKAKQLDSCGTTFIRSQCECGHVLGAIICSCCLNICSLCLRHRTHRFVSQICAMLQSFPWKNHGMKLNILGFYLPYGPTVARNVSPSGLRCIRAMLQKGILKTWQHYLKSLSVPGHGPGMFVTTSTTTKGTVYARAIFFGREVDEGKLRAAFGRGTDGAQTASVKKVLSEDYLARRLAVNDLVKTLTMGSLPGLGEMEMDEPGEFVDHKLAASIERAFLGYRAVATFGAFRTLSGGDDKTRLRNAFGGCPKCGSLNPRTTVEAPLSEIRKLMGHFWLPVFARRLPGKIDRYHPLPAERVRQDGPPNI